mmetsp:Transcript_3907/g.16256  ORF Transcript_3907/g.16256 Transcript_3907/m.16256 type:complete len:229 (+) Transcript_3907:2332-3018(+)
MTSPRPHPSRRSIRPRLAAAKPQRGSLRAGCDVSRRRSRWGWREIGKDSDWVRALPRRPPLLAPPAAATPAATPAEPARALCVGRRVSRRGHWATPQRFAGSACPPHVSTDPSVCGSRCALGPALPLAVSSAVFARARACVCVCVLRRRAMVLRLVVPVPAWQCNESLVVGSALAPNHAPVSCRSGAHRRRTRLAHIRGLMRTRHCSTPAVSRGCALQVAGQNTGEHG